MTLSPGEKCLNCLHPYASHHEEGCAHLKNCGCIGFESLELEDKDHCCGGGCDCGSDNY